MWISDFAIRRPIVTIVLMLGLVMFGLVALIFLQTDEFPKVDPPVVTLSIPYPGASPESVEREVIDPVEDAISGISGVDKIHSTSLDSFGIVVIEFTFDKDLQQATQDVRDKLSEIRQDLPPEMEEPVITRFNFADLPIVSLTLSSDVYGPEYLTQLVDPGIKGDLQSVPGVAQVNVVGGVEPALTVELHPEQLQANDVSVGQVVQALQLANLAAPVGRLTSPREERTIRLQGRLLAPKDFEAIAVGGKEGKLVRLGEVASVAAGTEEQRTLAMYNGRQAVAVDVVKQTAASTTTVSDAVKERLVDIEKKLPKGVHVDIVRDSGVRVSESVADVERTLIEGALLTVMVVFVFLASWRSTVITGLALPVSVLASFIAVWALGFTLNSMSLLGLSLAIGILVDDAIVVRENIVRHMEMGKDHYTAAREGTAEIGFAVAATTFSIIVVFVPVAFMGGLAEQWLGPMALTIACSVGVSLLVSFSLDPMLSAYWADPSLEQGQRGIVLRVLHVFDRWLERRTTTYKRVITWALGHRIAMVAITIVAFVSALALPATGLVGSSFFPAQDRSEFNIHLDLPPGSSLEYSTAKTAAAEAIARQRDGVEYTYSTVGGQGQVVDEAQIYVRLKPKNERSRTADEIADDVRKDIARVAGVVPSIANGFGNEKQIELEMRGPDINVLAKLADELEKQVKTVPGTVDVGLSTRGQKPELEVTLDRDLAASLGLSVGQVAQALRPAFADVDVGDWVDPQGNTRDVRVRFAPESRQRAEDLESVPLVLAGPSGTSTVPLGQVATVKKGLGPAQIQHLDRDRVINVEANVAPGVPMSEVVGVVQQKVSALALPPGYTVTQGGDVERQSDVFTRMLSALGVAIVLMYFILVVQFGSFLDPVPIMISLPLSLIGVMLALLVTGSTLNLMSMIGVVLLMGIVAKNAILLVDFAKWAEERGVPRKQALVEAGGTRLRPILMTSVAIVAGMFPVALGLGEGADFRAPLGRAVIGGVITSTFLTLLVIPTLYDMLATWRDRLWGWLAPGSAEHGGHGEGGESGGDGEMEPPPAPAK